jgi:hypothetical protein
MSQSDMQTLIAAEFIIFKNYAVTINAGTSIEHSPLDIKKNIINNTFADSEKQYE